MPKEQINFTEPTPWKSGDGTMGGIDPASPRVTVHWGGDMVQLSLDMDIDLVASIVRPAPDSPSALAGSDCEEGRFKMYTMPLNRADLQRLIRAARRARDMVFEADE